MDSEHQKNKGRFLPGVTPEGAIPFSEATAKEMQLRSAAARKRNRTMRETIAAALNEDGGGGMTKMEILVRKAMANHAKGKLTFKDLKCLSSILGEDTISLETSGAINIVVQDQQTANALQKVINENGKE